MFRKSMSRKVSRRAVLAGTAAAAAAALTQFPSPPIAQAGPFKLGLLTVKTGPLAQGGIQMEQGVLTFLEGKKSRLAGRKVDFVVRRHRRQSGRHQDQRRRNWSSATRSTSCSGRSPPSSFARSPTTSEHEDADAQPRRGRRPHAAHAQSVFCSRLGDLVASLHPMGHYAAKEMKLQARSASSRISRSATSRWAASSAAFTKDGGCVVNKLWPPLVTPDYTPYIAQIADCDVVCQGFAGSNPCVS